MSLIVKNAVRELAKDKDMRISGDTFDAMDKIAENILKQAIKRASDNGRKTLKASDL